MLIKSWKDLIHAYENNLELHLITKYAEASKSEDSGPIKLWGEYRKVVGIDGDEATIRIYDHHGWSQSYREFKRSFEFSSGETEYYVTEDDVETAKALLKF